MELKVLSPILNHLDLRENLEIAELSQKIQSMGQDTKPLNKIILDLQGTLRENYADPYYEKSPFYFFLIACASSLAGHSDAINYAERAESQFKNQGKTINQSLSNWLLGYFLWEDGQNERAHEKIDKALHGLSSLMKVRSVNGLYADCDSCEEILNTIKIFRTEIDYPFNHLHIHNQREPVEQNNLQPLSVGLEGYIILPQLPTYAFVQAGSDGPIWIEPSLENECSEMKQLNIKNRRYTIFSVNRGDRRITLDPNRQYGWAEVEGNSMNNAQPTHIDAGNLVLFYQSNEAPENAIVIVSCPANSGAGFSYMVKRWSRAKQEFISDSSESGHPPRPCDKECRIIGIVSAVAKSS
jgi:hypothetical protein